MPAVLHVEAEPILEILAAPLLEPFVEPARGLEQRRRHDQETDQPRVLDARRRERADPKPIGRKSRAQPIHETRIADRVGVEEADVLRAVPDQPPRAEVVRRALVEMRPLPNALDRHACGGNLFGKGALDPTATIVGAIVIDQTVTNTGLSDEGGRRPLQEVQAALAWHGDTEI